MSETCQFGKSKRLPSASSVNCVKHEFDLIHCDLWGPAPLSSWNKFRYYVSFVDDYTRLVWYYPLCNKSDFFSVYLAFKQMVFTQSNACIKVIHSDGGGEFVSEKLKAHFGKKGILHQLTCPHTPEQAGVVERRHRSIVEIGLTQLFHSRLPATNWNESFQTAVYLLKSLPTKVFPIMYHPMNCCFTKLRTTRLFVCLDATTLHISFS